MTTPELFLASMLLYAPLEAKIPTVSEEDWPAFKETIIAMALDMQIMDKRETQFLFQKPEELPHDMLLLRRRHMDLKNAPRLEETQRLPNRDQVNAMLTFNRAYRSHLEMKQLSQPHWGDHYREVIQETDRLHELWDAVRDARCDFYYVTVRRLALKKLQNCVGEEDFASGNFPPSVPTWRFQEVK